MARQRHLSRAPAREALIDIQFEPRVSLEAIERFITIAEPEFQRKTDLWEAVIGLTPGEDQPQTNTRHAIIGKRLDSDQRSYVLQCRASGFTLSRLSPYGEWKDLRSEALRWWEIFRSTVQQQVVTRIAVRYINEIKLPLPMKDFEEYLTCPPRVPDSLPQGISGFLHRVIIPDESNNCVSIVTQAMEGQAPVNNSSITVLLDIDVFRIHRFQGKEVDEIWAALDVLRDKKNLLFFEHLTEKTVEMFE